MKRSVLALVLLVLACGGAQAQESRAAADAERLAWTQLRGSAIDLSVGSDGAAFALDREGQVWLRRSVANAGWVHLPGKFARIDAASEKVAWAEDADGALFRYNGSFWREIPDTKALDVSVSPTGDAWAVMADGTLARFVERQASFVTVPDAPKSLVRLDVDDRGLPWVVEKDGTVQRFDGRNWIKLPGNARDVSTGPSGTAYIVSTEHEPMRWVPSQSRWQKLLARADVVAAGADGNPWIATPEGEIFAHQPEPRLGARARANGAGQVFTQVLPWRRVNGDGRQVVISRRGDVAALGVNGEIWRWKGKSTWGRVAGKLAVLAIDPDGVLWGVDDDGHVLRQANSGWQELPGRARLLAVGADGSAWIVAPDGRLARWQPAAREWQPLEDRPHKAQRLAVDPAGRPWIVRDDGTVAQHDGKQWLDYPGIEATDLAVGPEGSVMAVAEGKPWRYNRLNKRWEQLTGEVATIAVGPRGLPWATTAKHEIYASGTFDEERGATVAAFAATGPQVTVGVTATPAPPASGAPSQASAREPLGLADFRMVPGAAARDIAIGLDGSVFIVAFDGTVARWSNTRNAFVTFPGQLARIAVAPDGKPWGVTVRGEVYHHDGTDWRIAYNVTAQDIAIAANGAVVVAGLDEVLYRYNAVDNRFDRILPPSDNVPAPAGSRVALDAQGRPWTVTKDYRLWRCDRSPCELQAIGARDVAIGPDGSVFVADVDHRLRRFNPASNNWDFVGIDADLLAVGPGGRPWIVNARSEVWLSAFFRRDESRDLGVAASTSQNTTTAPTSVFTFSVAMPFDKVSLPASFAIASPDAWPVIAAGPNGKIAMIDANLAFWSYNDQKRTLVADSPAISSPWMRDGSRDVRSFLIAPDGTYWISDNPTAGEIAVSGVWRRQSGQWVAVPGLADCAATPNCTTALPAALAAAPDGTVYATSQGGNLYRYDTATKRFTRVVLPLPNANAINDIAIDPTGRLWVTTAAGDSPGYPVIYERVGNAWVARANDSNFDLEACIAKPTYTGVRCVAIGATGVVYQAWRYRLRRWNAASAVWENISTSPNVGAYSVATDGRPWIWDGSSSLYKAR